MKPIIILFISFYSLCSSFAQSPSPITIGEKRVLYSSLLGENRTIWIYTPSHTSMALASDKKYPVLYLLDGEAHFYGTVGMVQALSQANLNGILPEMIIVGIENTNRTKDLSSGIQAGGTKPVFCDFIANELIPYIEKNFPASAYRCMVGHSLGGLMALDLLANRSELFNAYIAIDPSLWFDQQKHLQNFMARWPQIPLKGKRLFIGIANTLPVNRSFSGIAQDKSPETLHIRSILQLDRFIKSHPIPHWRYRQQYYAKDNHNSVVHISIYEGLRFIFDYYSLNVTEKDFLDSSAQFADKLQTHYRHISRELGYAVKPPMEFVSHVALEASEKKYYSKAVALFELNINYYQDSGKVYADYGDYFLVRSDTLRALELYRKAFSLQPDSGVSEKIRWLTQKPETVASPALLREYQGEYLLEAFKLPVFLIIENDKLLARMSGQADSEFILLEKDLFTVKGKSGYRIRFKREGDKIKEFTSVQPNGTFRAIKIEK